LLQINGSEDAVKAYHAFAHTEALKARAVADQYARLEFQNGFHAGASPSVAPPHDEGTEWPPGSGISYTRHFAPDAYASGFRLAKYAQALWDCAGNLRAEARLPAEWTWPMKSFEGSVVYLLTVIIPNTAGFEGLTDEQLIIALKAAGLIELEKSRTTYLSQGA
jgi:hypothetical protein